MKYLIFSDTHLTHVFEENKYNFLVKIISNADKVIINGDFWDGYLTTFDKFVNSGWKKLFPFLLEKKAVYLYGNHDSPDLSDQRVNLFSVSQSENIIIKSGNKLLSVEHGQNIFKIADKKFPRFFLKPGTIIYDLIRHYFFKNFQSSYLKYFRNKNQIYKIESKKHINQYLVVGHSHGGEFSPDDRLFNSGFIHWGYGSYLTCEDGKIEFKEEEY